MTKSEVLLGRLIEERLTPGANIPEIDQRIRSLFEEEWAVVFTDMVGFSQHGADEGIISYLCRVHELKRTARPVFESNGGLILKVVADTFLVIFRRAPDALRALLEIDRAIRSYNQGRPEHEKLEIGAGIGFGKMLKVGDEDVFGVEVNYASTLGVDVAQPSDILVTDNARAALLHTPGIEFEPVNEPGLRFPAFRVRATG